MDYDSIDVDSRFCFPCLRFPLLRLFFINYGSILVLSQCRKCSVLIRILFFFDSLFYVLLRFGLPRLSQ